MFAAAVTIVLCWALLRSATPAPAPALAPPPPPRAQVPLQLGLRRLRGRSPRLVAHRGIERLELRLPPLLPRPRAAKRPDILNMIRVRTPKFTQLAGSRSLFAWMKIIFILFMSFASVVIF
jgi:hypothetical protein